MQLKIKPTGEVLLTGGAFGSVAVLQRSGVGPACKYYKYIYHNVYTCKELKNQQIYTLIFSVDNSTSVFEVSGCG